MAEDLMEQFEELARLARKGKRYDADMKARYVEIEVLKSKVKQQNRDWQGRFNKQHHENLELKKTHPDYESIKCPDCNGAGGFDGPDGGEPCHCDGGTAHIKKG